MSRADDHDTRNKRRPPPVMEPPATGRGGHARTRGVPHTTGMGALIEGASGSGPQPYRAYDNRILGLGGGGAFNAWRHWREDSGPRGVIAAGVLAASPHNTQPWYFRLEGDRLIEVHADTSRRMRSVDPYAREMHIGLGCALENMVLAARVRGFDPDVVLRPDAAAPTLVARVELQPGVRHSSVLYEAIGRRHSNRGPYRGRAVPEATLAVLAALATEVPVSVAWVVSREDRDTLGRLMVDAARAVTADAEQSMDGFAWFRTGADEIGAHKDGLTPAGQGMTPLMTAVAKLLPASSRGRGDAFWVEQTRKVHTATAAAYGFVLVHDPHDPVQQLIGGRVLERIHLAATARGLALHHMNQITERIDREESQGRSSVYAPVLAALTHHRGDLIHHRDGLTHHRDGRVLATFRLGYPVRAGRRSPRRPVAEVLR